VLVRWPSGNVFQSFVGGATVVGGAAIVAITRIRLVRGII